MNRNMLVLLTLLISACASFDRTNIKPGQRVTGLGFSFAVPTHKAWFAAEYGTSHRIKLNQLNDQDSYSILVSLNRGPVEGMYQNAETHLKKLQHHKRDEFKSAGLSRLHHKEWVDSKYGKLCVRYTYSDEDWRGRNTKGPAMVDLAGLSCAHPEIANVIISFEISRRFEVDAATINITAYADELFSSIEYSSIN